MSAAILPDWWAMIWILLAKLCDPIVIVLGLVGGRMSKTWLAVGIVAVVLAAASSMIFGLLGGPIEGLGLLGDVLAAGL